MHYIEFPQPTPIGVFDYEDTQPGVSSVELPVGTITRFLRDATRLAERLDDAIPGLGDLLRLGSTG